MKVILTQDIKGTGKKGDIINASDGYARNFLLPRKLAVEATAQTLNDVEVREQARLHHIEVEKSAAAAAAARLEGKSVTLHAKAGQNGKLFGAVTSKEIAAAIKETFGMDIDKKKITISGGDIKTFGTFETEVKLYTGITAKLFAVVGEKQ
ncbi:MAG: 50S ribosomal protein L9 [Clostridia bacterium]|nr:50S ribosomal protein L9 [Clostridia bacterium]